MIDFDALVLSPCEATFAVDVQISPEVSRPGYKPYLTRGIFTSVPLTVEMQDGSVFSDVQTTLGIRASEFPRLPGRGDRVKIMQADHPAYGRQFWVGDSVPDGQGGVTITLRETEPK